MKFDTQLAADTLLPKYESLANDIRNNTKNDLSQSPFKDVPDTSLFGADSFEKQKPILTGFQNENFSDAYETLNSGESVARYENYLAGTDNMDRLAKEQSGWEQLGYGAIKWLGKTGTAALGGTLGSIYGIGQMISEGSLKASYDNDFSRYLMDLDTKMNYKLPNYYTKSAQDLGFFGQLTQDTGNFIGDKVLGGLAFTTGAIVSEGIWAAATGGSSLALAPVKWSTRALGMTKVASAVNTYKGWVKPLVFQAFGKSKKAAIVAGQITDAFNTARFAYTSAGFEAGIEALHFRKEAQENFRDSFEKINGRPITAEDEQEFQRQLDNTSNSVYATNLFLVGSSNLITLGKVFDLKSPFKTGFSDFMNKKVFGIVGEVAEDVPRLASRTATQKVLRNVYYYGKAPVYEGLVEEGLQGVTNKVANQWIEAGYNPEAIQEYAELAGMTYEGLTEQYGTKEGWVEIGVGMIIGALGGTVGARSEMKSEEEKALFSASFDDTFQAKTMAENFLAASRMQVFNQEAKTAEQRGQLVKAALAGNKTILAQLNAEYQKSGDVMGLVEQNRVALETLTDEQFLAAGIEKEQIEDYKKQTIESYDKLARQFKQNRKFAEYTIGRSNLVGLEEIVGGDISATLKTNNKESLVQALAYTLTMGENASALMVDIKSRIREEAGDVASKTLGTIEKLQTAKAETKQKVDENRAQIKALEAERIGLERELLKLQNAPKPTEKDAARGLEYSRISDRIIEIGQIVTDLRGQLRDIAEQLNTGTKIEGEVKAVEAGLDSNNFDLTEKVEAKDLEDLETNIENFDNVLESLRTSNPRKYEYLKGLTNEFRDANKAFMDFQNTSIALSSGKINIRESNNWLSKMLNSKKSQDQFTKDWLVDILQNYQAFKSKSTANKVEGQEAITRDESEISFGQTRGFTIKSPTIEEQIASLEEQLREVEKQIPTQNKPIRVFRTEGTGLGNLGVAYRGTGVYYALDKPFLTGREGETVTELTVVLPQNTLDTTTEEGSAIFAEIQKEAAETFNNSDKSKPFYDILRDVAVSKGYDGVISFIETEDQSQGREFVSYKGVLQDLKLNNIENEESNTEILLEGVQETGNENEARQKSKQLRQEIERLKELAKGDRSDAQVLRDRLTAALKGKYRRLYQRVGEDYQEAFAKKPTQEELDEYLRLLENQSDAGIPKQIRELQAQLAELEKEKTTTEEVVEESTIDVEVETNQALIDKKVAELRTKLNDVKNNISSFADLEVFLNNFIAQISNGVSKDADNLLKEIQVFKSLIDSKTKKATQKGKKVQDVIEDLTDEIRGNFSFANQLTDQLRKQEESRTQLQQIAKDLQNQIAFYEGLKKQGVETKQDVDAKINSLKAKRKTVVGLIQKIGDILKRAFNILNDLVDTVFRKQDLIGRFTTLTNFQQKSREELAQAIQEGKDLNDYGGLNNEFQELEENLNTALNQVENQESFIEENNKRLADLNNALTNIDNNIRYLEELKATNEIVSQVVETRRNVTRVVTETEAEKQQKEEIRKQIKELKNYNPAKRLKFLKQKLGNWRLLDSVVLGEDTSIADTLEIMSQVEMQIEAEQTKTDITVEDAIETNIKDQSDGVRVDIAQNTHGSVTFTKKDGNLHLTHLKMSTIARNHGGELKMVENGQEILNPTKEQADNALKGTVFTLDDVTFTIIDGGVLQVKASAFTQDFQNKANMLLVGNTVQNMNWSSLDVYTAIDGQMVKMPSDFVQEGLQEQKIYNQKVGAKVRFVIRKTAYEKNLLEKLASITGKGNKAEKQRAEIEQQLKDTLTIQVVDSNGTVISTLKRSRAGESESFTRIRERAYEKFQANRDIDYDVDLGIETEVAGIFPGSVNLRIENDVIVSKPFTERATEEVLATGYVLNNEFTLNTTFSEEINRDYVGRISKKNSTQKIPVVIIRKGAYLYAYPMSLQKTTVPKGNIIRGILAENITMAEKAKKVNQAIIDNKTALGLRVTSDTLEQKAQQIIEAFDNFQSFKTADEIAQNDYNKKDLVNDALINIDLENMGQTISDPKLILDLKDSIVFEEELAVLYAQEVALVEQINDFVQDLYKKTYVNAPEYLLNTKDLSKNKAIDDIIDGANIIIKSRTGGEIRENNFFADKGNKNALLKIRDGIGKISTDWKNYLGEATLNKVKVFSNVYENLQEDIRKNKERIKNGKDNSSCPK